MNSEAIFWFDFSRNVDLEIRAFFSLETDVVLDADVDGGCLLKTDLGGFTWRTTVGGLTSSSLSSLGSCSGAFRFTANDGFDDDVDDDVVVVADLGLK